MTIDIINGVRPGSEGDMVNESNRTHKTANKTVDQGNKNKGTKNPHPTEEPSVYEEG